MTILRWGAVTRAASRPAQRPGLPPAAAFWLVAGAWFLLLFAAAAPSPLYGVYQAQRRFSAITLTAVFGVYAFGLLGTRAVNSSARRRNAHDSIRIGAGR